MEYFIDLDVFDDQLKESSLKRLMILARKQKRYCDHMPAAAYFGDHSSAEGLIMQNFVKSINFLYS